MTNKLFYTTMLIVGMVVTTIVVGCTSNKSGKSDVDSDMDSVAGLELIDDMGVSMDSIQKERDARKVRDAMLQGLRMMKENIWIQWMRDHPNGEQPTEKQLHEMFGKINAMYDSICKYN